MPLAPSRLLQILVWHGARCACQRRPIITVGHGCWGHTAMLLPQSAGGWRPTRLCTGRSGPVRGGGVRQRGGLLARQPEHPHLLHGHRPGGVPGGPNRMAQGSPLYQAAQSHFQLDSVNCALTRAPEVGLPVIITPLRARCAQGLPRPRPPTGRRRAAPGGLSGAAVPLVRPSGPPRRRRWPLQAVSRPRERGHEEPGEDADRPTSSPSPLVRRHH